MLSEDLDVIAEMALRMNIHPTVFFEAVKVLADVEGKEFFIFETYEDIDYVDFTKISTTMLQDIVICLTEMLKSDYFDTEDFDTAINVGVKAELEGLINKYDLEARYLSSRRFKEKE